MRSRLIVSMHFCLLICMRRFILYAFLFPYFVVDEANLVLESLVKLITTTKIKVTSQTIVITDLSFNGLCMHLNVFIS